MMPDRTPAPPAVPAQPSEELRALFETGYLILRQLAGPDQIERIVGDLAETFAQTPFCRGDFYGERTKRFGRLPARSASVHPLVLAPPLLNLVDAVLGPWCDTVQLNVAQAIEVHPGAVAQYPHRDQDMWPDASGSHEYLVNVLWPLDRFTSDNGATRIWPRSHGRAALDPALPDSPPVVASAEPGDAIVILGSTLHAAGANVSMSSRRAIVIGYSLGWVRPYENLWLAYPPATARSFPPVLAELAGYRQHRPNLGNFEGQCPSILLGDAPIATHLPAVDALRPDQAAALRDYTATQRDAGQGRTAP